MNIQALPREIIYEIFEDLTPSDLCTAAKVSKWFKAVSESPRLWKAHLAKEMLTLCWDETKHPKQIFLQNREAYLRYYRIIVPDKERCPYARVSHYKYAADERLTTLKPVEIPRIHGAVHSALSHSPAPVLIAFLEEGAVLKPFVDEFRNALVNYFRLTGFQPSAESTPIVQKKAADKQFRAIQIPGKKRSILHNALKENPNPLIVSWLVQNGAKPSLDSLDIAIRSGCEPTTLRILINAGGLRPDSKTVETALQSRANVDTFTVLLEAGTRLHGRTYRDLSTNYLNWKHHFPNAPEVDELLRQMLPPSTPASCSLM